MKRIVAVMIAALAFCSTGNSDSPPKDESGFVYARIRYHMTIDAVREREVPWHHDYPFGDEAFPAMLKEATEIHTTSSSYRIVDIDSPEIFKYPFAYLCEPGYLELNKKDADNFREYLDRGGFVMVDDFRGPRALENLVRQMKKVYPDREIVRLDISHPIFHSFYDIKTLDMEPPYRTRESGGVEFLGLSDPHGNLQMVIDYNNDLSEFWEWLDRQEMSLHDATVSLRFGINYIMYAMTH